MVDLSLGPGQPRRYIHQGDARLRRPYSIAWAVVLAIIFGGAIALTPAGARQLPSAGVLSWLLVPALLFGIPFSAWLPHVRAGAMGDHWHVPSHTLLLPRWLVCLIGTQMIGISLGALALCVMSDIRYGLLCVMHSFGTVAFIVSANRRFARHPKSEFVMRSPFR